MNITAAMVKELDSMGALYPVEDGKEMRPVANAETSKSHK